MSDTYQVCESCTHRFAVPIGARASKCETCAALDRKDAEITRLHAEAAELRAQLTAGPGKVLRCAFCGFAYPDGTPTHKHESLAAHVRVCTEHPVGKELRALRADLASAKAEVERLRKVLQEIASPDAKGEPFSMWINGERRNMAAWSMVQWRMDAAEAALAPTPQAQEKRS